MATSQLGGKVMTKSDILKLQRMYRCEKSSTCKTVGGPSPNQPCVFPFKWNGKTYSSCPIDSDDTNETWCSVKTDSNGNHITGQGLWGHCGSKCKKELWRCFSIGWSIKQKKQKKPPANCIQKLDFRLAWKLTLFWT